jgi:hypothetical protein
VPIARHSCPAHMYGSGNGIWSLTPQTCARTPAPDCRAKSSGSLSSCSLDPPRALMKFVHGTAISKLLNAITYALCTVARAACVADGRYACCYNQKLRHQIQDLSAESHQASATLRETRTGVGEAEPGAASNSCDNDAEDKTVQGWGWMGVGGSRPHRHISSSCHTKYISGSCGCNVGSIARSICLLQCAASGLI